MYIIIKSFGISEKFFLLRFFQNYRSSVWIIGHNLTLFNRDNAERCCKHIQVIRIDVRWNEILITCKFHEQRQFVSESLTFKEHVMRILYFRSNFKANSVWRAFNSKWAFIVNFTADQFNFVLNITCLVWNLVICFKSIFEYSQIAFRKGKNKVPIGWFGLIKRVRISFIQVENWDWEIRTVFRAWNFKMTSFLSTNWILTFIKVSLNVSKKNQKFKVVSNK